MTDPTSEVLDLTRTDSGTAQMLIDYFAAKTRQDAAATLNYFSPDVITYTDAPLGWATNGKGKIVEAFSGAMPQWGDGTSYPTAILGSFDGGDGSALVAFTNTPGIVGNELLHVLAAVDVRAGKIVRWIDYWDSASINSDFRAQVRTPAESFPSDFGEDQLSELKLGAIKTASSALHGALASGDASGAAALFDYDATWEDLSLHIKITGRPAIESYLRASFDVSPLGQGSRLRHSVGRDDAGGFEWVGAPTSGVLSGITALRLTKSGEIATGLTVYDGQLLDNKTRQELIFMGTSPRPIPA